jgi:hypothetical protein
MKTSHPITDARGRTVHLSMLGFKPLCKPGTKIVFHATLIGKAGTKLCKVCAERDLRAQFDAAGLSGGPIDEDGER